MLAALVMVTFAFTAATVYLTIETFGTDHPPATVTVTTAPRPTTTVTVTAPARQPSATASAVPKPTATMTQFVAISSGGGNSGWTGIASVSTALAGVGTMIGGYATFAGRRRRHTEPVAEKAKPRDAAN